MYRVFLGAPTKSDLDKDPNSYQWYTRSQSNINANLTGYDPNTTWPPINFPAATLEAASRRISLIYQNTIFNDDPDEELVYEDRDLGGEPTIEQDQTTLYTWPPTAGETGGLARPNDTLPSFLLNVTSKSYHQTAYGTQLTQGTQSYNYSDTSSITHFPAFQFSLHTLTSLSSLSKSSVKGTKKVNMLLAVLEVEGPNTIRIKKGPDAGNEVSILSLILGDEEGLVCKLTAWREVADTWGGGGDTAGVKRGDVLFIESIVATWDSTASPSLSASPHLKSKVEICFRTMPYTHEDNRLRPDLRLAENDPAVRRVAAIVRWFEGMAGLNTVL